MRVGKATPSKPGIRHLQAIKGGSYTLTLPRWWVTKYGLGKGMELFLVEDGFSMRVAPMKLIGEKKRAEISFNSLDDEKSVRYLLWTYYMQGADEIVVRSKNVISATSKKVLREVRLDLAGIEIADETSDKVVFAVTQTSERKQLSDMITGLQNIAISIHRDAMIAVSKRSSSLASEVVGREPEMLRNYRSMIRKLAICSMNAEELYSSGIKDSRELITYALLARDLNRTAYHAIYIAKHILKLDEDIEDEVLRSLKRMSDVALEMQKLAVESFLEKSFSKTMQVIRTMDDVRREDEKLSAKITGNSRSVKKAVTEMLIAREIRRIAGYSVGMADAAANRILSPMNQPS